MNDNDTYDQPWYLQFVGEIAGLSLFIRFLAFLFDYLLLPFDLRLAPEVVGVTMGSAAVFLLVRSINRRNDARATAPVPDEKRE